MSVEGKEIKRLKIKMSKQFDYLKNQGIYFLLKRESINRVKIGYGCSIISLSSINGRD